MIKLVFGQKNKIIKYQNRNFFSLRQLIKASFPQAPLDYSLSYIDQQKDQICLNSDQDLKNMFNTKSKLYKVYIKESLFQSIVVDLDRSSQVQVSVDNTKSLQQNKTEEKILEACFQKSEIKNQKEQIPKIQTAVTQEKQIENNQPKQMLLKEQVKKQLSDDIVPLQKNQIGELMVKPVQDVKKIVQLQIPVEVRVVSKVEHYKKEEKKQKQVQKIFDELEQVRGAKKQQQSLHIHGVICSNCKDEFGILGIRYQCILCHYYNLCSKCEAKVEHQHALLKIKTPKHAISQDSIIQKYKNEFYLPVQQKVIPHGHYVPSINKDDAMRILYYAKQSYQNGYNRAKQSMEELFTKLLESHQNPYQMIKTINAKPQSSGEIAKYLSQLMGIPFNQAYRFVNKHANQTKQRVVQSYLSSKK